MTTAVTIKAASHDVEVYAVDKPLDGQPETKQLLATVTKGSEWTTHAWNSRAIVVQEVIPNA